jgi:rod shape-determining protein MreC
VKKFLRNNGIFILVVAVLLTAIIGIGSAFVPGLTAPAQRALGVLATPFRAAASFFVDRVEAAYDYAFHYQSMKSRVAELEEKVATMEEENRQAKSALEENDRLRELLKLSKAHSDFTFVSANVTARSATSWSSTLTLSKGSADGITTQTCVVTATGELVGVVTETGANWSEVTTIIDPSISLGARISPSQDAAVLTSSLDYLSKGQCALSYLDTDAELSVGDTVLTSGLGGVYPAGLTIGTIAEEGTTDSGMERYAVVTPAADLGALGEVFVITSFDVEE